MTDLLETVEIVQGDAPRSAVIWLHGLGADGNDFAPIVPDLGLKDVRFVFPHAPVRPVTLNGGMPMRAWFDISSLENRLALDHAGLAASVESVDRLIKREIKRGIPASRIVVAGFSQGGATAVAAGLNYPEPLAGIIGLSTWAAFAKPAANSPNRNTPVFIGHGNFDPVVSMTLGEQTRDMLKAAGMDVVWNSYPMAHAVCPQEIADIAAFLHRVLPDG